MLPRPYTKDLQNPVEPKPARKSFRKTTLASVVAASLMLSFAWVNPVQAEDPKTQTGSTLDGDFVFESPVNSQVAWDLTQCQDCSGGTMTSGSSISMSGASGNVGIKTDKDLLINGAAGEGNNAEITITAGGGVNNVRGIWVTGILTEEADISINYATIIATDTNSSGGDQTNNAFAILNQADGSTQLDISHSEIRGGWAAIGNGYRSSATFSHGVTLSTVTISDSLLVASGNSTLTSQTPENPDGTIWNSQGSIGTLLIFNSELRYVNRSDVDNNQAVIHNIDAEIERIYVSGSSLVAGHTYTEGENGAEGAWSGKSSAHAISNQKYKEGGIGRIEEIVLTDESILAADASSIQNEDTIGTISVLGGTKVNTSDLGKGDVFLNNKTGATIEDVQISGSYVGKTTNAGTITEYLINAGSQANAITNSGTIDKLTVSGENTTLEGVTSTGTISTMNIEAGAAVSSITYGTASSGTGSTTTTVTDTSDGNDTGADGDTGAVINNSGTVDSLTLNDGTLTVNLFTGINSIKEYAVTGGELVLNHKGETTAAGGKVTISDDGSLNIKNLNISITDNLNSDHFTVIGASDTGSNLSVENFTITSFGNADLKLDVLVHVLQDAQGKDLGSIGYADGVTLSDSLLNAGLSVGSYDEATGVLKIGLNALRGASSVMSQMMISQLVRRDYFIDTALAEASQEALLNHTDTSVFVKPYFGYDTFDLDGGMDATSHTKGFIAGVTKNWNQAHVLTAYVGYETAESSAASMFTIDSSMAYAGVDYTNTFATSDALSLYIKGRATFAYLENEIERMMEGKTSSATPQSLAYSANAYFGGNWYLTLSTVINPEIGLSYLGGHTESFEMGGDIDTIRHEKYDSLNVDLFFGDASLSWEQNWHEHFRTRVSGGVRYLFNDDYDVDASINGLYDTANVDLPSFYQYASASIVVSPNKNVDFALTYAGIFDSMGHSHNAIAKFQYNF